MNDILVHSEAVLGCGFVADRYLAPGEDEYRIRNAQLAGMRGKAPDSWRPLTPTEIETLIKNDNRASDWGRILVRDPFDPTLVRNSEFAGLVRIGSLERVVLEQDRKSVV